MQTARTLVTVLFFAALSACGNQTSEQNLAKELQTVTSWTATAHVVADSWRQKIVPTAYAKQTLQKAHEELGREVKKLTHDLENKSQGNKFQILQQISRLDQITYQMMASVEAGNRSAIAQQLQQLSLTEKLLNQMAKKVGEPS